MLSVAVTVNGVDVGELGSWLRLAWRKRLNEVTGFVLTAPADAASVDLLAASTEGNRVGLIVTDTDHDLAFSGTVNMDVLADGAVVTASGTDDLSILNQRYASPQPSQAGPPFATSSHWSYSGTACDAFVALIDANFGAAAHSDRSVSALTVVADKDLSSSPTPIVLKARFEPLVDLVAERGGPNGLAVNVLCDGNGEWLASVRESRALGAVVFDDAPGTRRTRTRKSAAANVVLVGGAGEGIARMFNQSGSIAGIDRVERFDDARQVDDSTELAAAASEAVTESLATRTLDVSLTGTNGATYGRDFLLGDWVWLVVGGSEGFVRVTGVDLVSSSAGEAWTLTVGVPGDSALVSTRSLARRLSRLEKGV